MPAETHFHDSDHIVGREAERDVLRACLERVTSGSGTLLLISGESGIGKTALTLELIREANEAGFSVRAGGCYDVGTTPPYGPWIEALQDEIELPEPSAPAWIDHAGGIARIDSQDALFEETRRFLLESTSRQPALIVLEDLHWADPSSVEMLRYLARSSQRMPLLLAATFREDEPETEHPLYRVLPHLVREARPTRISLQGLTDEAVRRLVQHRYALPPADEDRLVSYLQSRTEGNPFFLTELVRLLEHEQLLHKEGAGWRVENLERAPVPPLVRQLIEDRLTHFDDDVRELIEVAAVIGQEVPVDIWQAVTGASLDELAVAMEQARAARLIADTADRLRTSFTHAQVRTTLYEGITLPRRRAIHRHIADVLVSRPKPSPNLVASHLAEADDPSAVEWLVRAGEEALALYSAHDAIAMFNRAQDIANRLGEDTPTACFQARATAYEMLGDFDGARRDYETVLERSRASGDRAAEWQALLDLGLLWAARDYERTGRYYRAALDLARNSHDDLMIAYSLNRIANWHVNQEQPDIALPLHREALDLFEQSADQDGIADTLDHLGMASYLRCDLAASTEYCERAIHLLRERDDRQRLSTCLATLPFSGGDPTCNTAAPVYRESTYWIDAGEEALAIAREIDWPAGEAFALFSLSLARSVRGDLERALREAETALRIADEINHHQWQIAARSVVGTIWAELLDTERAKGELEQALTTARRSGSRFWTSMAAAELGSLLTSTNALGEAEAILESTPNPDTMNVSMGQRQVSFARAELALACGDADRALSIIEDLERSRPKSPLDRGVPQLQHRRGTALRQLDRFPEAEAELQTARESATLFGYLPLCWQIDLELAELYREMSRPAEVRESLQAAQATIDELAEMISTHAIRETFLAGTSARLAEIEAVDSDPQAQAGLSPRELEVLKLIAEGKTDREIADDLYISPRTVMRHVGTILNKLDVSSRTAAASRAIRENII